MPLMFLALAYFVQETGELCLSPVGLSEITKLAPPLIVSTLMAVFFLSNSGGQLLAGWIAAQAGTQTVGGQVVDPKASLDAAIHIYGAIGWGAIGVGVVFVALSFLIKGWAHGADDTSEAVRRGLRRRVEPQGSVLTRRDPRLPRGDQLKVLRRRRWISGPLRSLRQST